MSNHTEGDDQALTLERLELSLQRLKRELNFQFAAMLLLACMGMWVIAKQQQVDRLTLDRIDRLEQVLD